MKPSELVEMDVDRPRVGEEGEGRGLECEEDAEREEGESDQTCAATVCPVCLLYGILGLEVIERGERIVLGARN